MSSLALKHICLTVFSAAGLSGAISVAGSLFSNRNAATKDEVKQIKDEVKQIKDEVKKIKYEVGEIGDEVVEIKWLLGCEVR
jgi:hypothetical protein